MIDQSPARAARRRLPGAARGLVFPYPLRGRAYVVAYLRHRAGCGPRPRAGAYGVPGPVAARLCRAVEAVLGGSCPLL